MSEVGTMLMDVDVMPTERADRLVSRAFWLGIGIGFLGGCLSMFAFIRAALS